MLTHLILMTAPGGRYHDLPSCPGEEAEAEGANSGRIPEPVVELGSSPGGQAPITPTP